jgi:quercetin dioxygenase-like cupin family protein
MLVSDDWEPGARTPAHRRITVVSNGIDSLLATLPVASGRARRRQVLKTKGVRILRLSFDAGQVLAQRAESSPLLIQTLQGRVTLTVEGEKVDMPAGAIIHLEKQVAHSIAATETSHVMVTLLGPRLSKPRATSYATAHVSLGHAVPFREPAPLGRPGTSADHEVADRAAGGVHEWARHNSVLTSTGPNAHAFDEITRRHATFLGELAGRTSALLDRLAGDGESAERVAELVEWVRVEVLPQLRLEEEILYPVVALRPQQRPLVSALSAGLEAIAEAVERLADVSSGATFDTASAAIALRVIIGRHLTAESEVLLPTLAISTDESLVALWARMGEGFSVSLGV